MKITRFALGIRFAAMAEQPHKEFARKIFEGIFSVLTLSELEDLTLYGAAELYSITNAGIMTIGSSAADTPEETVRKFDSAADRMFRFIRMGRDVEKIGAPKQPKLKPWLTLLIDSWKK